MFLSGMSIPKKKLVYTAVSGLLPFLQIPDINHNGTYSIPKDLKTTALFPFSDHRKITDWLAGF